MPRLDVTARGRWLARALVCLTVLVTLAGCGGGGDLASAPDTLPGLPKKPVTLNIVDVAGNLALTQGMIERYRKTHPALVRRITFTKAPSPELAGKVKAQQDAGRLDIDLVLTGNDALSAGVEQSLWVKLLPAYQEKFPGLEANYLPPAANMQKLAKGYGVAVTYYPSGPLLEYAPERVPTPPTTPAQLLAWAKAHPGRFLYARPANSGPGRTFLMGLPYILGDKNPKDPINGWAKTWSYLKQLGKYIDYYASGTGQTMEELGNGSRDIIATTTGWDINPRVLGTVPKGVKVAAFNGFHWVTDAHYMVVPKGIAAGKLAVVLDLMAWMLKPAQQALAFDEGYFYPGPAVRGVTIGMAPKKSRDAIAEYGRPEYARLIESRPKETPLDTKALVAAFDKWDREIGGSKVRE